MIGTAQQDAWLRAHKYAVLTTLRSDGSPTNSVVFCAYDGDTLYFSTMAGRLKARTVAATPRVAVTVLDEGPPHGYVTIEGTAAVQQTGRLDWHRRLMRAIRGDGWQEPADYAAQLERDGRVIIRVTPQRVHGVIFR